MQEPATSCVGTAYILWLTKEVGISDILIMNVQTIIQKAGGVGKLATLLGVSHPTVSEWKRTGFIPGGRLVQISRKLDVKVEELSALIKPSDAEAA